MFLRRVVPDSLYVTRAFVFEKFHRFGTWPCVSGELRTAKTQSEHTFALEGSVLRCQHIETYDWTLFSGGVGSVKETPSFGNNAIYANRRAVLKCLLVCLSSPLYMVKFFWLSCFGSRFFFGNSQGKSIELPPLRFGYGRIPAVSYLTPQIFIAH